MSTPAITDPNSNTVSKPSTEPNSQQQKVESTAKKVDQSFSFENTSSEFTFEPNEVSVSLKKVQDSKRTIDGRKVEVYAKKPREKKTKANLSPTEWESLDKATQKAKEIFWPEKTSKKVLRYTLLLPISAPLAIATGATLATAHGAKTLVQGYKYLKANTCKSSILPPPIYNLNPFRKKDFVQLTEQEKDEFCEKMDKAWKKFQKKYNKDKNEDEKILTEDVYEWGFDIPKSPNGRFGFKITYRIPDKNGKYVKGQNKDRRYKVDKNNVFVYKTIYLFWGKLDLNTTEDPFVESLSIVKDWDVIDGTKRITAPTLAKLKEKIENKTHITNEKSNETGKQNCWLHTAIQRALHDQKIMEILKDEKKLNEKFLIYIRRSNKSDKQKIWQKKSKLKNLIECIQKCADAEKALKDKEILEDKDKMSERQKSIIEEQKSIIEEKYDDTQSFAEKIRKDFGFKEKTQQDPNDVFAVLQNYLIEIGAIDTIEQTRKNITDNSSKKEEISSIIIPVTNECIKDSKPKDLDLRAAIDYYFREKTENGTKIQLKIDKKPSSITIEISDKANLKNVPLSLTYEDLKFQADNNGQFKFNYATIHEGSKEGGHYFSIYKENDSWYLYDNTKNSVDQNAIDDETVLNYLKNARTLTYVDTAIA